MLTGKAVARAIRGYFLIESVLYILLIKRILIFDITYNVDGVSQESNTDVTLGQEQYDSDNATLMTQQQEEIK